MMTIKEICHIINKDAVIVELMHLPFVNIIIFMARQIVLKFTVDALILSILFSDNILVCTIYCQLEKKSTRPNSAKLLQQQLFLFG